jgi:thymidylate kinase
VTEVFIVVEGIDLVGKTVQANMLARYLRDGGIDVTSYSFPAYDSPTGRAISAHLRGYAQLVGRLCRPSGGSLSGKDGEVGVSESPSRRSEHDSLAFQCLQLGDKYAVAPEIEGHLVMGRTVVCCRWWQSAVTYGVEDGVDADWTRRACARLPRAGVNVLLDLDPARARRRPGESLDRLEADLARQSRVRQRYLDLWRCDAGEQGLWAVVDAEGTPDAVHGRLLAVLGAAGVVLRGVGVSGRH